MNPFDMLKNIEQMKSQLGTMQEELKQITATGSSGGNIVNVTINGKFEIINLKLDPICVDPRDVQMLQDLIIAAHHDAMSKIQEAIKEKYGPLLNGMNIPGM
ncbi:MAG: YbaB/EbfC family nucleoid-associated protein [Treponema sp.]|uniref:YbaB/EbfC family nucleoid-associated protein n=1 Tax=Treponema sp. TaxID=166 RepID=UPI001DE71374|nr:YbaB/EbfC family nucleoid-associated protein [Treponema sp.]MBS7311234.1 YbaB/EbfC family nucleoid-associated protein [Treponema sp.]MCI5696634.1 YbaB/EbfC family nucleoid-associated protein [Spirochaetia bacterium]MDY5886047.1 YbaB/EbfC family nucleoid-associated protein [Treponema sp.]